VKIDKTTGVIEFGSISVSPETMTKDVKSRYRDFILRTAGGAPDEKIILQNDGYWFRLNFNADRNALWTTGLKEMNHNFLLLVLKNWWFDASAKVLAEGYRDYVRPLNLAGTVATAPEKALKPGDLAITDDGVHVMVYLAPDEWISADPGQGKVVIEHPSESKNPWFVRPVHFYRWSIFRRRSI
jgi:hypothetical protein vspiD_24475